MAVTPTSPANARAAIEPESAAPATLAQMIRRRRSTRSDSAPSGSPNTRNGAKRADRAAPTMNGEPVSSSIVHVSATWLIAVPSPMLARLTHSNPNPGTRNAPGSERRVSIVGIFADARAGSGD